MINRIRGRLVTVLALVAALGVFLGSVDRLAAQPTTSSATSQPMEITITGVEGMVQVRDSSDQPWKKATVGMTLTEGAEFRTGIKSAVRVYLPPDQTIT